MNQLGWHWWPSDTADRDHRIDGRAPCINLGHCTPACAQGAKASTDVTYWPHAIRAGVELRTTAGCGRSRPATTAWRPARWITTPDGVAQFQPAEVVIVACNGVGTPRLLLHSASGRYPERAGQFQRPGGQEPDVPSLGEGHRLCRRTDGRHRGPPLCLWSQEFYETDRARGFVRGYNFQFNRSIGIGTEAVSAEIKGLLPWGEGHHDVFRGLVGHRMTVGICTEDLPEDAQPGHPRSRAQG